MSRPDETTLALYTPVVHPHPQVERCTAWRLPPCLAKSGANDYFTFWVRRKGAGIEDVEISLEIITGKGVLVQKVPWVGVTNQRGSIRWQHPVGPYAWDVKLNGALLIANLTIACPWNEYCDPSNPGEIAYEFGRGRPVNTQGHYGYIVDVEWAGE